MKLMRIMGYKNFGFAKAIMSKKLGNEFLYEGKVKSTDSVKKFFKIIKENNVLQNEFNVYESIENKYITNDALATKYIDEAINIFEKYSKQEVSDAHDMLVEFLDESFLDLEDRKRNLYEAINNLIFEKAKGGKPNIDLIHESFEIILEYIKTNKPDEEDDQIQLNEYFDYEDIIKTSIDKFNTKYSSLNENQRTVLNKLVFGNESDKKQLFESLKHENLELLSKIDKNGIEDKIVESISKISNMQYNPNTLVKDVVSLCDLKSNLS